MTDTISMSNIDMTATLAQFAGIMDSLPSMSAGYVRPISNDFIDEVLGEDAISAFEPLDLYNRYDMDEEDNSDTTPAANGRNVYVGDAFSFDPAEFPDELVARDHALLSPAYTDEDFVPDELAPHKSEHSRFLAYGEWSKKDERHRGFRSQRRYTKRNRTDKLNSRQLRLHEQIMLEHWQKAMGYEPVNGVYFDDEEPVIQDVIEHFEDDDQIFGMSFEDYDWKVEHNILGSNFYDERFCCGGNHGSNYHTVLGMPTGRILHDRVKEFEWEIHDEWKSVLPAWSNAYTDTEYYAEKPYSYSMWLSRLQYLVLTGVLSPTKDDNVDPHLFGDCDCARYRWWYDCPLEDKYAPVLEDEIDDGESLADLLDDSVYYDCPRCGEDTMWHDERTGRCTRHLTPKVKHIRFSTERFLNNPNYNPDWKFSLLVWNLQIERDKRKRVEQQLATTTQAQHQLAA